MGVSSRGRDATVPEGAQIGLGVRTAAIRRLQIQGALTNTGNSLDLAINGRGWFQVTTPTGDTVYTRDGAFNTNATGQLVTTDGYTVTPAILIPANATSVTVSQTGLVTATIAGQTTPQQLGQLTIANFVNEAGLQALGEQSLPADRGVGSADCRRSRRHGVRHRPAGLSRSLERRPGVGNHQPDRRAARLRDEFEGDSGRRSDVGNDLEYEELRRPRHARRTGSPPCSPSLGLWLAPDLGALGARRGLADPQRRHLSRRHHPRRHARGPARPRQRRGRRSVRRDAVRR